MSQVREAVQKLYNTYPFPPDPLMDEPPSGYNWRWHYQSAYNFCTGVKPPTDKVRILDAGCGTGSGTEYLMLHNPDAEIIAIDLSEKALETAQRRIEKSGIKEQFRGSITFKHMPLETAVNLEGTFDLINCVGVLHHLPDPNAGIKALANKLAEGGIMHIFVYGELGRWEIQLMQRAIALLQGEQRGDYIDGVKVGRDVFNCLPETNRLVKREKERWEWENKRDESFADMYVHPCETDYNVETLFDFINCSGLEFIGFSNPDVWQIDRLLGQSEDLMNRVKNLSDLERYRLIEVLDPEQITHYEFFLGKAPLVKETWQDDGVLQGAKPELNPCLFGWPSKNLLDYQFKPVAIDDADFAFMQLCAENNNLESTIGDLTAKADFSLDQVRLLIKKQLIMLTK